MPFFDMPLAELTAYKPDLHTPDDFDAFWEGTLTEARQFPLNPIFGRVEVGLKQVEVYDVTFNGFGGQPIKGWYLRPANVNHPLPCVVEYIGYGGGRGYPLDWLTYAVAGYAHLVMDTRGQGSTWRKGDTPDIPNGANPALPGFMTQGILSPTTYYYRRVFTDAVRAVEAAQHAPLVDADHLAVTGGSQGGGISVAVSGLLPDMVELVMPSVPFLCHFQRALELFVEAPYSEILHYLRIQRDKAEQVFQTLAYFDGLHFAPRAKAKALYSVGLMDTICPPSCVYGTYNHVTAPKEMRVYTYNGHEGGETVHLMEILAFLHQHWGHLG